MKFSDIISRNSYGSGSEENSDSLEFITDRNRKFFAPLTVVGPVCIVVLDDGSFADLLLLEVTYDELTHRVRGHDVFRHELHLDLAIRAGSLTRPVLIAFALQSFQTENSVSSTRRWPKFVVAFLPRKNKQPRELDSNSNNTTRGVHLHKQSVARFAAVQFSDTSEQALFSGCCKNETTRKFSRALFNKPTIKRSKRLHCVNTRIEDTYTSLKLILFRG